MTSEGETAPPAADRTRAHARAIVMAIRPVYSRQIFAGAKRVELRRRRLHAEPGERVWVYESQATKALVGSFVVARVVVDSADAIWERYAAVAGIDRAGYDAYMSGLAECCAIEIVSAERIEPVPLARLREHGFRAPQSWAHMHVERLLGR